MFLRLSAIAFRAPPRPSALSRWQSNSSQPAASAPAGAAGKRVMIVTRVKWLRPLSVHHYAAVGAAFWDCGVRFASVRGDLLRRTPSLLA